MSAREFLMVVKESAFGTPKTTPVAWTTATTFGLANFDLAYVRLTDGNAFTTRSRPVQVETPYGGGIATPAYRTSDKQDVKGKLKLKLCVGQSPLFLSWAGALVSGGTSPWTTSVPNGDLPSCSVYHAVQLEGGTTFLRKHYTGVKVEQFKLSVSEQSTEATLELDLCGSTVKGNSFDSSTDPDATEFPAPADNQFPTDPYLFIHGGGSNFITVGGTVRTQFTDLSITVQNTIAKAYFANRYYQMLSFRGRKSNVVLKNLYGSATDRSDYETLAAEAASIELNNGSHGVTFNFNSKNVLDPLEDDLGLGNLYFQTLTSHNLYDAAAGADFSIAFA